MQWQTSRYLLDLTRPKIMGIVNLTPDSFSDGGQYLRPSEALAHCERLLKEGADILDLGGESSRPGSPPVPLDIELNRVLPVVREAVRLGVPISVDTYKPEVMRAVLDLGADIINDIWALRRTGALQAVAAHSRCGVCLMHMHRDPTTMQLDPMQGDAVLPVSEFLLERVAELEAHAIARNRMVLDPGIGFGKSPAQNFALLAATSELLAMGFPLLAAWSRKSSLAQAIGRDQASDRMVASVSAALLAVDRGARVVRVHDVKPTREALQVWRAVVEN